MTRRLELRTKGTQRYSGNDKLPLEFQIVSGSFSAGATFQPRLLQDALDNVGSADDSDHFAVGCNRDSSDGIVSQAIADIQQTLVR